MLVSVGILSQLTLYLRKLNIDVDSLFASLGMDASLLTSPDAQIPFDDYIALETRAAEVADDPFFGLHMGESIRPGHYGIIGFMMMNSSHLGEAMRKLGRYNRLIGTVIRASIRLGFKNVRLILSVPADAPTLSRHCIECAAASLVTLARHLTGADVRPLAVSFTGPAPRDDSEYRRVFGCHVCFDQGESALVLDPKISALPVLSPNKELLAYFEDYAQSYLREIEESGACAARVTKILLSHLDQRTVRLKDVARAMSVSSRTLQKRLREEGVVFRDLLFETRRSLAQKYLRENRTVEEISYLLGYAEASVFSKAFKKWYGQSPKAYRASIRADSQ